VARARMLQDTHTNDSQNLTVLEQSIQESRAGLHSTYHEVEQ